MMTLLSKFYAVDTPYTRPMETQAVLRAVTQATGLPGNQASRDLTR